MTIEEDEDVAVPSTSTKNTTKTDQAPNLWSFRATVATPLSSQAGVDIP
jgi:hypothetical protein